MRAEVFDYETHSCLAGPLAEPDPDPAGTYRVQYRSLLSREELRTRIRAFALMTLAPSPPPRSSSTSSGPRTGPSARARPPGWSTSTP